jgi:4-amino-4-deoxy-L-arabinose transferase-like glycosyltransferase
MRLGQEISTFIKMRIVVIVFMLFSLAYLFLFFNQGINVYDEGIVVYGATRILDGDIPYKDFWAIYSPAQFYVIAGVFKIFGTTIIIARIWSTLIRFSLLIVSYSIARKFVSQTYAFIASILILIWLGSYQFYESAMPTALLFSLLSFLSLMNFMSKRLKRWLFLSGVLVGVAALFRQDIGFYAFMSTALVVLPFVFVNETFKDERYARRFLHLLRFGSCFAAGTIIITLPVLIYFLRAVPSEDLVYDFFTFPVKIYPAFRSLPYPAPIPNPTLIFAGSLSLGQYVQGALQLLPLYLPLLIYALFILVLGIRIRKRVFDWKQRNIWGLIFILLFGLMCLNHVRIRTHISHLMATFIPAILLYVVLFSFVPKSRKFRPVVWISFILLGYSFIGASVEKTKTLLNSRFFLQNKHFYSIERARGIFETNRWFSDRQNAIQYIQKKVPANEKIYVGNKRHDQIIWNDIIFYFLSNRHSATKYYDLHPGVATTDEIQEKMIDDIETNKVKFIVLFERKIGKRWESNRIGSRLLDNFIRDNFTQEKQFGIYTIWKRNQ